MGPPRSTSRRPRRWGEVVLLAALLLVPLVPVNAGPPAGAPGTRTSPSLATTTEGKAAAPLAPMAGGQGRVLVNTTDTASVPNDGLRMNLTDFPAVTMPPDSSFQASAEEGIGGYQAVFGIFENSVTPPTAFYSIFTNQTNQNVRLGYWSSMPLVPGEAYDFALVRTNGTNWTLTVNGVLFGGNLTTASFDFGAVDATWLTSVSFSEVAIYATTSVVPAILSIPLAFAVHRGAGWYLPGSAQAWYVGGGGAQWGVQGRIQRGTLAPGELESGSTIGNVTSGTSLWTGGIVPVVVALAFASPSVVATSPTQVTVTVRTLSNAPIPSVPVYLSDALNGSFVPPTVDTDPTGSGSVLFETPNVSAPVSDAVRATVTVFGYSGVTTLPIGLTPPAQVVLTADPPSPAAAPGGRVLVTFLASDPAGTPVADVQIEFAAESAGGASTAEPGFGSTGSDGRLSVTVAVPSVPGTVVLTARVSQVGAWGHATVQIAVRSPPVPFWVQYETPLLELVLGAAFALLAMVVLLRRRRRRRAIPSMPLRRYIRELKDAGPTVPAPGTPPVSRRPPSSGSP